MIGDHRRSKKVNNRRGAVVEYAVSNLIFCSFPLIHRGASKSSAFELLLGQHELRNNDGANHAD